MLWLITLGGALAGCFAIHTLSELWSLTSRVDRLESEHRRLCAHSDKDILELQFRIEQLAKCLDVKWVNSKPAHFERKD